MMDSFHLFNIDQCENLPDKLCPEQPVLPEAERIAGADKIVANGGVPVRHNNGGRACYHPVADHIIMPQAAQFRSPADYYSTLLHELVHSTGHVSRLARKELWIVRQINMILYMDLRSWLRRWGLHFCVQTLAFRAIYSMKAISRPG